MIPSRNLLVCGSDKGALLIFDTITYKLKKGAKIHRRIIRAIELTHDEKYVITSGYDSTIKLSYINKSFKVIVLRQLYQKTTVELGALLTVNNLNLLAFNKWGSDIGLISLRTFKHVGDIPTK